MFNHKFIKDRAKPGSWRRGYEYHLQKQVLESEFSENKVLAKVKGKFQESYSIAGIEEGDDEITIGVKLSTPKKNLTEEHIIQLNKFSSISAAAEFNAGKKSSWLKILFNPFYRFVRDYFLLSGWRDGFYGYIICRNNAYSTFLKYVKLKNLYKGKQP